MNRNQRAAQCRQRIGEWLQELARLAKVLQGHAPLVRGSFYRFRRKCGKAGCRCVRGELHHGQAFAVREGGRSRTVPLTGLDRAKLVKGVGVYRGVRRARAEMVQALARLLAQVDRLVRLREIPLPRLRQNTGRREYPSTEEI